MRWNFRNKKIEEKSNSENKPSFKNPLFIKSVPWRDFIVQEIKLISLILLLLLILIVYFLFFSNLFKINEIELTGFNKISANKISKKFLSTQLNNYRYLVFRQNNLLIFSKDKLIQNIKKDYNLDNISINKEFPHKLLLTIQEKSPFLIYSSDNSKYYLDENGVISSKLSKIDENESITIITNDANEKATANEVIFSKNKMSFILSIAEKLSKIDKINITSYSIPNKISFQLNVNVDQGYSIYFDMNKNIDDQITKLRRVLYESKSGETPTKYIDLRIGERVYIK